MIHPRSTQRIHFQSLAETLSQPRSTPCTLSYNIKEIYIKRKIKGEKSFFFDLKEQAANLCFILQR